MEPWCRRPLTAGLAATLRRRPRWAVSRRAGLFVLVGEERANDEVVELVTCAFEHDALHAALEATKIQRGDLDRGQRSMRKRPRAEVIRTRHEVAELDRRPRPIERRRTRLWVPCDEHAAVPRGRVRIRINRPAGVKVLKALSELP